VLKGYKFNFNVTLVYGCRTNHLGFGAEFMGRVRLVTAIASLAGVGVYNAYLKHVSLKKIFFWSTIISVFLGLTQVGYELSFASFFYFEVAFVSSCTYLEFLHAAASCHGAEQENWNR